MDVVGLGSYNIIIMALYGRSFWTQIKESLYKGVVKLWRWSVREDLLNKKEKLEITAFIHKTYLSWWPLHSTTEQLPVLQLLDTAMFSLNTPFQSGLALSTGISAKKPTHHK